MVWWPHDQAPQLSYLAKADSQPLVEIGQLCIRCQPLNLAGH